MNLVTADIHLSDNPNEEYRHAFMREFVAIAKRRKADRITILGDLTERKDHHSAVLVNKVVAHLKAMSDVAPVDILMGNHDYHNEGHPFFEFVQHVQNIRWIGTPTVIGKELYLPHTRDYKNDWKPYFDLFKQFNFVFCHNTFNGASVGFGRELEGIPLFFPRGTRVIAGDIHVPQTLGPVTYVGAPYTVDFGDDYKPRLLALEGTTVTSLGVSKYGQKRLVSIDDLSELDAAAVNEGDILKVRVAIDDMGTWHSTHKAVLAWAADKGVHAQRIEPVLNQVAVKKRFKVTNAKTDDSDLLTQYAKRHTLTEHTLKVGIEIMGDE